MVDLDAELDWPAAPLCLDDRLDVWRDVVRAALDVVRHRPQVPRLLEVVDVLGEPDLVDPALGSSFDEALKGFDGVVDGLVRRAEMHVVVDDQSQDATSSRSAGVVTFSRRVSPSTARTRPPFASTSEAQSVDLVTARCKVEKASRRAGPTKAWGVWVV